MLKRLRRMIELPGLLAVLIAFFALAAPLGAATFDPDRLLRPWPKVESGEGGTPVSFPSRSPFSLADAGKAPWRNPKARAKATLHLPRGVSAREPVPAVILLHGAGGILTNREPVYAAQYAQMGIAALVIHVYEARNHRGYGFVGRLLNITESMFIADAYAGLRYLARRPEIDSRRVALIGFSYGGMATMYAAYRQVARAYAPDGPRFAAHVAYYGPCIVRFADSRATGAPLLMLMGDGDAITDQRRCAKVAGDLRGGGAAVRSIVYRGAYHQWDGNWRGPFSIGRSLAPCRYWVHRDGTIRDLRTLLPMADPFTRKITLGLCASKDGYMIGADPAIRVRSNRDVGRFLARVFRRGG
ncbi:MAG TPA: dienelactone hydrolase family protein [Alphaproteobacteria bacterium]|nr:dienelactone hydrolase family protein [Alphaproteobacteria bacterium]